MTCRYMTRAQIEEWADNLNRRYRPERLIKPSEPDIYDIPDLLGARISWDHLTPDRSILGVTTFGNVELWIWPEGYYQKGKLPELKRFRKGTIIIDNSLANSFLPRDKHIENFTVAHECFHFDNHQSFFENIGQSISSFQANYLAQQQDEQNPIHILERHANYGSAAFMMPRMAVINGASDILGYRYVPIQFSDDLKCDIEKLGTLFGVNYQPMKYRLQQLKIIQ